MKMRTLLAALLLSLGGLPASKAYSQTAGQWFPATGTAKTIKTAWYDFRSFGGNARIGFQFNGVDPAFYYYFSPVDQVQVMKANAVYATLLTAVSAGEELYVLVADGDGFSTGSWRFTSIGIGPQ